MILKTLYLFFLPLLALANPPLPEWVFVIQQEEQRMADDLMGGQISDEAQATIFKLSGQLVDELNRSNINKYLKARSRIQHQLQQAVGTNNNFWIMQIDKTVRIEYIVALLEEWKKIQPQNEQGVFWPHIISQIALGRIRTEVIKTSINNDGWINKLTSLQRGKYEHNKSLITLELLPPDQFTVPLAHELAHALDDELALARNDFALSNIKPNLEFYTKDINQLNNKEKAQFAKYWFLNYYYLPWFKELKPRLAACQVFKGLYQNQFLITPSADDLKRYEDVINKKISCGEQVATEWLKTYKDISHYWHGSVYQDLIDDYIKSWLRDNLGPKALKIILNN